MPKRHLRVVGAARFSPIRFWAGPIIAKLNRRNCYVAHQFGLWADVVAIREQVREVYGNNLIPESW